jgi:hypothetical protein
MKRSILRLLVASAAVCVGLATAEAKSKQVRFVGIHPIAVAHGGGFCHIEAPHVHAWTPSDARLQYRDHDGDLYFVGDPVAYGWDGQRHAYRGHHPIHVDVVVGDDHSDVEYCYLDGPHFHGFAPAPVVAADFKLHGDAYWYVGAPAEVYVSARPQLIRINALYTPIVYQRPVLTITTPPPGWIGISIGGPAIEVEAPVVVAPRARAAVGFAAGVEVHVPAPTLSVEVGLPGVYVGGGVRRHRDVVIVDDRRHKHKKHRHGRHRGHRGNH